MPLLGNDLETDHLVGVVVHDLILFSPHPNGVFGLTVDPLLVAACI
jgi:hypothetical protein